MTLLLTIPSNEGMVMASDGQVTLGLVKTRGKKIQKLNENCVWGAAGDLPLIQLVEEQISGLSDKTQNIQILRKSLCDIVVECVKELPPGPQPYSGNFIFAEYQNSAHVLQVRENGISVMLHDVPFAVGIGDHFAYALLQKYQDLIPEGINNELSAILAYKIITETMETISVGIGPPIYVWQLPPAKNLSKEELTGLEDTYSVLREAEIEMFLKRAKP